MHAWVVHAWISFINSTIAICRFLFTHGVIHNQMNANPKWCGSHEHVTSQVSQGVYYVLI